MDAQNLKYAFLLVTVVAGTIAGGWMMSSEIDSPEIGDVPEIGECGQGSDADRSARFLGPAKGTPGLAGP